MPCSHAGRCGATRRPDSGPSIAGAPRTYAERWSTDAASTDAAESTEGGT